MDSVFLFMVFVFMMVGAFGLIVALENQLSNPATPVTAELTATATADSAARASAQYRKLSAFGCLWHAITPHFFYAIPGVLLVSLAHGWF